MDKKRVLIVDDNKDLATSTARLLRLLGYEAEVVHDGHKVVEAARACDPQLILLDIGLPDLDGYRVAKALREAGFTHTIIAAVSGYGLDEDRRRSLEVGMDHHLTKPVDIKTITDLIADA